jgi:serine/threonine protein kinase
LTPLAPPSPSYKDINRSSLRPDSSAGFTRWCRDHLMDQAAVPLLQKMLTLDPRKRISAVDALMVRGGGRPVWVPPASVWGPRSAACDRRCRFSPV